MRAAIFITPVNGKKRLCIGGRMMARTVVWHRTFRYERRGKSSRRYRHADHRKDLPEALTRKILSTIRGGSIT